jgi:haloacetate dehalogenase
VSGLFSGFDDDRIDVGEVTLRVRCAGTGPAALLVHGHPRTGATWHRVAPQLVQAGFTVACPDMRGYGQRSKRAVAADRGCYVALRMALDHPDVVSRLVVMDGVPISDALVARCYSFQEPNLGQIFGSWKL